MLHTEKQKLFEQIWNDCKDSLLKHCKLKMQCCYDEIDDVIADAFFYLWKAIYNDVEIKNYKNWLFSVTEHLIVEKYCDANSTAEKNVQYIDVENEIVCFVNDEYFIDSLISDIEIEDVRSKIISELKKEEQELYTYVYERKLKTKEIAIIKNSTESAIKQKRYRLNKKLKLIAKKHLEDLWIGMHRKK